jgi:hypothetical protein
MPQRPSRQRLSSNAPGSTNAIGRISRRKSTWTYCRQVVEVAFIGLLPGSWPVSTNVFTPPDGLLRMSLDENRTLLTTEFASCKPSPTENHHTLVIQNEDVVSEPWHSMSHKRKCPKQFCIAPTQVEPTLSRRRSTLPTNAMPSPCHIAAMPPI